MDEWMARVTEWMAADSSRRGFFRRVAAIGVAGAALISGRGANTAEAIGQVGCCSGLDCRYLGAYGKCPSRYPNNKYNWICCTSTHQTTICHDCYDPRGRYGCTYNEITTTAC
jgi:hypothetical protein